MRDTIIKGTGNSRYLKSSLEGITTWEQFRAALLAGTLPIDLSGVNEEGMQQLGSPLNKATLLKDNTAGLYGLTAEALPDDVLQALANNQAIIRSGYVDGGAVAAGDVVNMDDVGSVYKQISYENIVPKDTTIRNLDNPVWSVVGMEDGNAVVLYSQSSGVYSIGILRASTQTVDSEIQITDVPGTSDWTAHAAIAKLDGMHFAVVSSHESTNTSSLTVTVTIYRYVNGALTAIGTGANSTVLDNIGLASLTAVWLSETQLLVLGTFSGSVPSQPTAGALRGLLVTVSGSQIAVPTTTLDLGASTLSTTISTLWAELMHVTDGTAVVAVACKQVGATSDRCGSIAIDLGTGTVTDRKYTPYITYMPDIIRLTDHVWCNVRRAIETNLKLNIDYWRITDADITPVRFYQTVIEATDIASDATWWWFPAAARTKDGLIIASRLTGSTEFAAYAVTVSIPDESANPAVAVGEPVIVSSTTFLNNEVASIRGFEASDAVLMAGTNGNGSTTSSVITAFRAQQYGTNVARRFRNTSYMGIALEAGSNGDAIRVAYQGTIRTSLLAKDDYIDSDGVLGYSPVEGVMDVRPYWAPRAICGSYVGTGVYGSAEPNRLGFPSPPRAIFLLMGKHMAIFRRGMDYVTTATDGNGRDFPNACVVTWDYNQVLWYNSESAFEQFNTANATYNYLAIM